eukprot:6944872-Pyramimonas_sp.AAC.1
MGRGWSAVRGPAGAVTMSLRRAGWSWPDWRTFRTRDGHLLRLSDVCPMDVQAMLKVDLECHIWAERT